MNDRTPAFLAAVGLCSVCRWSRVIETRRGSRFYLCQRARSDPRFPQYPRLPVVRCVGFEPAGRDEQPDAAGDDIGGQR